MKYYLKVALITLAVSVGVAEIFSPWLGLNGFIAPMIEDVLEQKKIITLDKGEIAKLELTSEKDKKSPLPGKEIGIDLALDACVSAIKQLSLFPEFTQIPAIKPRISGIDFQFKWDNKIAIRTLNTQGAEVGLPAVCKVNKNNGLISELHIDKRQLVSGTSVDQKKITGDWKIERSVSSIDNSTNVVVSGYAAAPAIIGDRSVRPEIVLQCSENKTILYIGIGEEVGAGTINTSVSLGGGKEQRSRWNISADRKNIFPEGQYIGLIRSMLKAPDMLVGFSPSGEVSLKFRFKLAGLQAAVYPLQEACHWK